MTNTLLTSANLLLSMLPRSPPATAFDGVTYGIISAPGLCHLDPRTLAGQKYGCCPSDNTIYSFSTASLEVAAKIYAGPTRTDGFSLWFGITLDTSFSSLAPTDSSGPLPFSIANSWFQNFLLKKSSAEPAKISYAKFVELSYQGHLQYDSVIGSADPDSRALEVQGSQRHVAEFDEVDLAAFKAHVGKILT